VFATTTEGALYDALTSGDAASGFLNRWVTFKGRPRGDTHEIDFDDEGSDDAPPADLVGWLQRAANYVPEGAGNLVGEHIASTAPDFFMSVHVADDGARAIIREIDAEQGKRLSGHDLRTRELWGRYLENVVKFSMIRAIADNYEKPVITAVHAAWARDIVRWGVEYLVHAMQTRVADTPQEREVNLLLNFIREQGGWVSASALGRGVRAINGQRRSAILADLTNVQGVLEMRRNENTKKPTMEYRYIG
jgi:hypothetical protein